MRKKADLIHLGGELYGLKFPYAPEAIAGLKQVPGCFWNGEKRLWQLPVDALNAAREVLDVGPPRSPAQVTMYQIDTHAHPYQNEGAWKCVLQHDFILNYEQGLGKTPTTIWALRSLWPSRTLIVCPALVKRNWLREMEKWWPEHPDVTLISAGSECVGLPTNGIIIVSYELAKHLHKEKFSVVVLDEIHYIKEGRSGRSKAVAAIRATNPDARFIGLSGTPITNEPSDLWHQLDVLWPGRFGSYTKFCERYCGKETQEHSPRGYVYKGLNPERAEELKCRLGFVSQRVTKLEVAHLLPAMTVSTRYVKQRHLKGLDELKPEALEGYQLAAGGSKVEAALEILDEARASGQSKFAVLTHLKATADLAAKALAARGYVVELVTGDTLEKERYAAFDRCRDGHGSTVLVATMHSVGIGVDLTFAETFVFAELYWSPSVVLQALGRFQRLSGRHNVNGYFIVCEGVLEESVARFLEKKIEAMSKIIAPGAAESAASGVVKARIETEEEMLAAIAELAERLE